MSNIFEKVFDLTSDDRLNIRLDLKNLINKELALGMTRYVCRNGTLGDGFEKLTDSQKYYQSIRECYGRANEMARCRANSKKAYADYLDAKVALEKAETLTDRLRAEAAVELAELSAFELTVTAEDTMRQFDEFNKVRMELMGSVRRQYPEGIEQAEPDNWRAVMRYRLMQGSHDIQAVPLPMEEKAAIGAQMAVQDERAARILLAGKASTDMNFALELTKKLGDKNG